MIIIQNEINKVKELVSKLFKEDINDERAFIYVIINYFYMNNGGLLDKNIQDIRSMITDGNNDGGVDFVFFDDENIKVILGQSKFTKKLEQNELIVELNKMNNTVDNFIKNTTGMYNGKLKQELQDALDRLPNEDKGNIEFAIFTTADVSEEVFVKKVEIQNADYSMDMISIFGVNDIKYKIESTNEVDLTVPEAKIKIDKPKNILVYENEESEGIMVNISSSSIIKMYNSYSSKGLFDMNIRKYIRNKLVDGGIKSTLDKDRDNFWFLNNGIIIACKSFNIDGNNIHLTDFSIVNGGQTTTLIGNYKGKNSQEFFIPCKIVCKKNESKEENHDFFTKIAEATNSQKPIYPRDLKSNSPEMRKLKKWMGEESIFLEIKRGENKKTNKFKYKIKNDEFGQIVLSFIHQKPGTSRSGKKFIFENASLYNKIYRNKYDQDPFKKQCIIDLIDLNNRYLQLEGELKNGKDLSGIEYDILKNGKQVIFSLMGLLYSIKNNDLVPSEILQNPGIVADHEFYYSGNISNYKADDIDQVLKSLVILIIQYLGEAYEKALNNGNVSSVSNFFKSDKKYLEDISKGFIQYITRTGAGKDILNHSKIFIRKS